MKPAVYKKNPHTAGRIVDGLAFVVTPDDNKLHTLNDTATHLWRLAKSGITVEHAADELTSHFQVDRDTALRDARSCLVDLVARQILIEV